MTEEPNRADQGTDPVEASPLPDSVPENGTSANITERVSPEDNTSEILAIPKQTLTELGINLEINGPDFSNMGEIGRGGSGLVMGATDAALGRLVAVKLLRPEYRFSREHIERMVREARATAQLEHPNIVPMHSLGLDKKYGVYFTMKKLQGDTLRNVLRQLRDGNPEYLKEYPWTKLLAIFLKACQGISYAHSKGVIHRDLKPENILVGKYGEVTIIDWGLVRKMKPVKTSVDISDERKFTIERNEEKEEIRFAGKEYSNLTVDDFINGTPRYMAPEQAVGWNSKLDHRCDIYAMGVILYEIMTFHNPFDQFKIESEVLNAVSNGTYIPPGQTKPNGKLITPEMEAICLKAMALEVSDRYQTVTDLIHDIYNYQSEREVTAYKASWYAHLVKWSKRNPLKVAVLVGAIMAVLASGFSLILLDHFSYHEHMRQIRDLRERGKVCLQELGKMLDDRALLLQNLPLVSSFRGYEVDANLKIEEKESELINIYDQAYLLLNGLSTISQQRPIVSVIREEIIIERLEFASRYQRMGEINRWLGMARTGFGMNFEYCSNEMRLFLKETEKHQRGDCQLQIVSQPFGAEVKIFPITLDPLDKCLKTAAEPLKMLVFALQTGKYLLPKGDYLLKFSLPDRPTVLYPLYLQHAEILDLLVQIPKNIPREMVYVPGGRSLLGGKTSQSSQFRTVNIPSFFILEREVTFAEYLEFWLSLGSESERMEHLSEVSLFAGSYYRMPAWTPDGTLIEGLVSVNPVVGISAESAMAYCHWLSQKNDWNCRLPTADEWEKAARGVDGRLYPWGNYFDSGKAFIRENLQASQTYGRWAPSRQFPGDVSIYGAYDMAGNVREWSSTVFTDGSGLYQIKGSSSVATKRYLPLGGAGDMPLIPSDVGFRYVIPLPQENE